MGRRISLVGKIGMERNCNGEDCFYDLKRLGRSYGCLAKLGSYICDKLVWTSLALLGTESRWNRDMQRPRKFNDCRLSLAGRFYCWVRIREDWCLSPSS